MGDFRVAIDGPAGSGKSTISKLIAQKIGMTHIDTGAMYRAVTLAAIEKQLDLSQEQSYHFLETTRISYRDNDIYIDDRIVTDAIRSKEVTEHVSLVSSFPYVRKQLVKLQKDISKQGRIIMDGRDIGTVVIPNAELKVFLTAHVEERAKRRQLEKVKKGIKESIHDVVDEIQKRDQKDSSRKESPLRKASDAIEIDTTHLSIDQTVDEIIELIQMKEKK